VNILKRTILSVFALLLSLSVILGMTPGKNSKIAVETVVLSPGAFNLPRYCHNRSA